MTKAYMKNDNPQFILNTDWLLRRRIFCIAQLKKKKKTIKKQGYGPSTLLLSRNFEFAGVYHCCTLRTIFTNYAEAVNSVDSTGF